MNKRDIVLGLLIALVLAVFISPFASPFLDGLEKVAEEKGFQEKQEEAVLQSPIPDYIWPGISDETAATSIAGLVGTLIVFSLAWGLALVIGRP